MKTRFLGVALGFVVLVLFGCGVSQEDHDAKLAELSKAQETITVFKQQIKDKDAQLVKLKADQAATAKRLASLQKQLADARKSFQEQEGRLAAAEEKKSSLIQNLDQLQTLSETRTQKIAEFENIVTTLRSDNASIQEQLGQKAAALTQLQGLFAQKTKGLTDLQDQFSQFKLTSGRSAQETSQLKALLGQKESAMQAKDAEIQSKNTALKKKDCQIQKLMQQIEALTKGKGVSPDLLKGVLNN